MANTISKSYRGKERQNPTNVSEDGDSVPLLLRQPPLEEDAKAKMADEEQNIYYQTRQGGPSPIEPPFEEGSKTVQVRDAHGKTVVKSLTLCLYSTPDPVLSQKFSLCIFLHFFFFFLPDFSPPHN